MLGKEDGMGYNTESDIEVGKREEMSEKNVLRAFQKIHFKPKM